MSVGIESLFTSALGLVAPWEVDKVELDPARQRIDFEVICRAKTLACPHCGVADQRVHDRLRRSWRHLDFFQYEAWLHADVPRVACTGCGKTTQAGVPWAREGSGFTALFEALALALCRELPVRQAAALLRCADKQLWRRIEHYVDQARALDDMMFGRTQSRFRNLYGGAAIHAAAAREPRVGAGLLARAGLLHPKARSISSAIREC
jgi:hypothetical protein